MEMIGEDNYRGDREWVPLFEVMKCCAQKLNVFRGLKQGLPLMSHNGKKVGYSWALGTAI